MKTLVIIPTYNEKENLPILIKKILDLKLDLQILVVDDNSPDGTGKVADELAKNHPEVSVLHRRTKMGLGSAYFEGFKWALGQNFDFIITMDADLSHNPKDILRFLEEAKDFDIVVGSRWMKGGSMVGFDFFRKFICSGFSIWLARKLLGLKTKDVTTGYKCYSRRFIESLNPNKITASSYAFQVEMIEKAEKNGFSVIEIPIVFPPRKFGKSKFSWREVISSAWALIKLKWSKK